MKIKDRGQVESVDIFHFARLYSSEGATEEGGVPTSL